MGNTSKFRIVRRASASAIRNLCIKNDWYSCGDNDEYAHLLTDLCENKCHVEIEDIEDIARDIMAHSEIKVYDEEDANLEYVMFEVLMATHEYIDRSDGND